MSCEQNEPRTAGECGPCSPARRNRYFPDKSMRAADFRIEQQHLIERRRLINRAMLGWGIVQGFPVYTVESGIKVGRGVAIDHCGRELVACEDVVLHNADDLLWLVKGDCGMEAGEPPAAQDEEAPDQEAQHQQQHQEPQQQQQRLRQQQQQQEPQRQAHCDHEERNLHYLLCAHYAERQIDHVRIDDGCGPPSCEASHICETVVYSLMQMDDCPPGLTHCLSNLWKLHDCEHQRDGWAAPPAAGERPAVADVHDRGTHRQLVHWSLERLCKVDFCKPCDVEKVGRLYVDLDGCVPLACVTIDFDECGSPYIAEIVEDWRPKRLARPNNILFDLIRGCDLVRIQDVGWSEWLEPGGRRVPLSKFTGMFERPRRPDDGQQPARGRSRSRRRHGAKAVSATHFWVCLSGPVQVSSLTPDVIAITLVRRDIDEDVRNVVRVPIPAIEVAPTTEGDPDHSTRAFRPLVSGRFWEGEISDYDATGFETENLVEIEVRTAFILDTLGQEVAGGGRFVPSSGCVPGGRFLSSFTVYPDEDQPEESDQEDAELTAEEA